MENVFCGNSLGLIRCDVCWDGIGQRGTWHETVDGYLWILVGMDQNPVASLTVLPPHALYLALRLPLLQMIDTAPHEVR